MPEDERKRRTPDGLRLSDDNFYAPTDADALRMENELLAFEVRFLRALLAGSGRGTGLAASSPARLAQLEAAEKDLVLLLRRLGGSPAGPLLRRRQAFRALEQKYLQPPDGRNAASPAQLEAAEKDLVLLLRRLGGSPAGPLLRRRQAFRALEQKYLRDGEGR